MITCKGLIFWKCPSHEQIIQIKQVKLPKWDSQLTLDLTPKWKARLDLGTPHSVWAREWVWGEGHRPRPEGVSSNICPSVQGSVQSRIIYVLCFPILTCSSLPAFQRAWRDLLSLGFGGNPVPFFFFFCHNSGDTPSVEGCSTFC